MLLYLVVVVRGGRRGRRVHAGCVVADRGSATGGGALAPRRAEVRNARVIVLQSGRYHPGGHHRTILHRAHLHLDLPQSPVSPSHLVLLSAATLTIACPSSRSWSRSSSCWLSSYRRISRTVWRWESRRPWASLNSQLRPCDRTRWYSAILGIIAKFVETLFADLPHNNTSYPHD